MTYHIRKQFGLIIIKYQNVIIEWFKNKHDLDIIYRERRVDDDTNCYILKYKVVIDDEVIERAICGAFYDGLSKHLRHHDFQEDFIDYLQALERKIKINKIIDE
jgi:hypothetical protein